MDEETGREAPQPSGQETIDAARMEMAIERLRTEQNLAGGLIAGAGGALVGAAAWALVTVTTNMQIGWMAVGVGFLVGIAIRTWGKGVDKVFGYAGAGLALLGCLAGNLMTVCIMVARQEEMPVMEVFSTLSPALVVDLMVQTFSPMDVLFYGIAVYEGYQLSFRKFTQADITRVMAG